MGWKINFDTGEFDFFIDPTPVAAIALQDAKEYADSLVTGLLDDRGSFTPSGAYPTSVNNGSGIAGAILKGDVWYITGLGVGVTALVGSITVKDGDTIRALIDAPGQTDTNWALMIASATVSVPTNTVNFDAENPNTGGTIFTPDVQLDSDTLYVSDLDSSLWTSDGIAYQTYTAPTTATTPFNILGTTIDAGGNKTAPIEHNNSIYSNNFGGKIGYTTTSDTLRTGKWYKVFSVKTYGAFESMAFTLLMHERGDFNGAGSHVKFDITLKIQNTTSKYIIVNASSSSYLNTFALSNFEVLWDNTAKTFVFYYKPTANYMQTAWTVLNSDKSNISDSSYIIWNNTYLSSTTLSAETNDTVTNKQVTLNQINGAYSLPVVDGAVGQAIITDGAGNTTFQSIVLGGKIGIPDQTTGIFTYYATPELAVASAVSGNTIYVYPGTYTITTTATNGLAKDGVIWYLAPNAIFNKATSGDMFNSTGFTSKLVVLGYGDFNKTGTSGRLFNAVGSNALILEANAITSTTDHCISIAGAVGNKIKFNTSTSSGGSGFYTNSAYVEVIIDFHTIKSTSTYAIGGYLNQVKMNLNGVLIQSTTTSAIVQIENYSQVVSNVSNVLGTDYGFRLNSSPISLTINGDTTGVIGSGGDVFMNGTCQTVMNNGMRFYGGKIGGLTSSAGYTKTSWIGYTSAFSITGGLVILNTSVVTVGSDRMAFNITNGKLVLDGDYKEDSYTRSKTINGGEVVINGDFITSTTGSELYNGVFNLNSGTLRIKGRINNPNIVANEPCVLWSGGKLIIEGGILLTANNVIAPIVAVNSGLVLKILNGFSTNYDNATYGVLDAKKQFYKFTINNVGSVNLTFNVGANITEADTATYNTKALLAERMKDLINASYANGYLIATYTATNEYFEVEALVAGTAYVTGSESNLSIFKTIKNSNVIVNVTNGVVTEDADVE